MTFSAPKPPHFLYFVPPFIASAMDEPRDFKFGTLTYHSKSHPADEKSSLKGAWSVSVDPFENFYTPCNFSATANARDFKFSMLVGHAKF